MDNLPIPPNHQLFTLFVLGAMLMETVEFIIDGGLTNVHTPLSRALFIILMGFMLICFYVYQYIASKFKRIEKKLGLNRLSGDKNDENLDRDEGDEKN